MTIGDTFDGFVVTSTKLASALEDYQTLTMWFKENHSAADEAAANSLYQWWYTADNKGTIAMQAINQRKG